MYRILAVIAVVLGAGLGGAHAQELQLATFQETAQVLVDRTLSGNVTASVTLQSTSNQEIKIPSDLNQRILDSQRIVSVVLTNHDGCGVLGVSDESCILVNVARAPEDTNIIKIQEAAKQNGDRIIGELNELFDTDATYHSSFLHHKDVINEMLGTSGAVSGRDVVSAVYTMPREDTQPMYQKISALTLDRRIRDSGGFYSTANSLASHENSHMALSILPGQGTSLFQLRVSSDYPGADNTNRLSPLDYFHTDEIRRSNYFAGGFYPLNSIFQVVILSPEEIAIQDVNASLIPTKEIDGEPIPTEFGQSGWVFDEKHSTKIEAKYLFGMKTSASSNELKLAYGTAEEGVKINPDGEPSFEIDESAAIVAIIVIFAAAAAGFYLRGYRRGP